MKKKLLCLVLCALCILSLAACGCKHETWNEADCVNPKTCAECGETEGEALGHTWVDADCVAPKTCADCGETEGEALGHTWVEADYENPKTCSVCAVSEGDPLPAPFLGSWSERVDLTAEDMGLDAIIEDGLSVDVILVFHEDNTVEVKVVPTDVEELRNYMINFTEEFTYLTLTSTYGVEREEIDNLFLENYNMTLREYVIAEVDKQGISEEFFAYMDTRGTYTLTNEGLYLDLIYMDAVSDPDIANEFTVEGDTLTLTWTSAGGTEPDVFTRLAE